MGREKREGGRKGTQQEGIVEALFGPHDLGSYRLSMNCRTRNGVVRGKEWDCMKIM